MDLTFPEATERVRHDVREFLAANLPTDWRGIGALDETERTEYRASWREALLKERWIAPAWPVEFGGAGLDLAAQAVVAEEFVAAGVPQYPAPCDGNGFMLLGPTMLHWGTHEQKHRFLPATVSGDIRWAQGYSEAEAGSDLFGLRTRAALRDGKWIIDGHKMWQTAGLHANWIFVLARTDPTAPKSKGLSLLLVPLDQPGVEVRGIRNMAGEVEFAEVFFDQAETEEANVLGPINEGAKVALTLLGFERGAGGLAVTRSYLIELERLTELARANGRLGDPRVLERLADCRATIHVLRNLAYKSLSAGLAGSPPGPESSVFKLVTAEYRQTVTELAMDLLGAAVLAPGGPASVVGLGPQPRGVDAFSAQVWFTDLLQARPVTVYGGSSQIQRDTISERVLGLPRSRR